MKKHRAVFSVLCIGFFCVTLAFGRPPQKVADKPVPEAVWVHEGKTSAVIYWRLDDISREAKGYVEYGETDKYGSTTPAWRDTRWAQLHWIRELNPETTYYYRVVVFDRGKEIHSANKTFTTKKHENAVEIKTGPDGKPEIGEGMGQGGNFGSALVLNKADTTYILTGDFKADGSGIEIAAAGITLELDGHTIEFSRNTTKQVFGIIVNGPNAKVFNGRIVQGATGGDYGYGFAGRGAVDGLEVSGLDIFVHRDCAYPLSLFRRAGGKVNLHHNHLYNTVRKVQSRHYPGNDLLRVDIQEGAEVEINDNIFTEGCHRAINCTGGPAKSLKIHHNDIRHHQQYVNGYAFNGQLANGKIYKNRVTSTGRTVHLVAPGIEFYENWLYTKGHMHRSDSPQNRGDGPGKWHDRRIELHGIKFEGKNSKDIKVHDNFMKIVQRQPDSQWDYVPATPLNIGAGDPNANNEVYNNKFVAITTYQNTKHGGYGASGQWASSIFFITSAKGPAEEGKCFINIHDNEFISNDIFIANAYKLDPTLTIKVENNTFKLGPNPTKKPSVFLQIPPELQEKIKAGNNKFEGMEPK